MPPTCMLYQEILHAAPTPGNAGDPHVTHLLVFPGRTPSSQVLFLGLLWVVLKIRSFQYQKTSKPPIWFFHTKQKILENRNCNDEVKKWRTVRLKTVVSAAEICRPTQYPIGKTDNYQGKHKNTWRDRNSNSDLVPKIYYHNLSGEIVYH